MPVTFPFDEEQVVGIDMVFGVWFALRHNLYFLGIYGGADVLAWLPAAGLPVPG